MLWALAVAVAEQRPLRALRALHAALAAWRPSAAGVVPQLAARPICLACGALRVPFAPCRNWLRIVWGVCDASTPRTPPPRCAGPSHSTRVPEIDGVLAAVPGPLRAIALNGLQLWIARLLRVVPHGGCATPPLCVASTLVYLGMRSLWRRLSCRAYRPVSIRYTLPGRPGCGPVCPQSGSTPS